MAPHRTPGERRSRAAGVALALMLLATALDAGTSAGASSGTAVIRVNQVGYGNLSGKSAVLLASGSEAGASYQLINASSGSAALTGSVGSSAGGWNSKFPDGYWLNFSSVQRPGSYYLRVKGPIAAVSPTFRIAPVGALYGPLLRNAIFFFQAQQDGPVVNASVLSRQPSHLTDENASVYGTPTYRHGSLIGPLRRIGGPVNVSGGWFDAGDYLKFVETASYTDALLLLVARDFPNLTRAAGANVSGEAEFGLDWLEEMWNESTRTLYYQVGIGNGNRTVVGDHDVWRLPQADDALNVSPGGPEYFLKYRPVFEAGPPNSTISPNLAGRLAADFGLCYQVFLGANAPFADRCLRDGETVFDLAQTANVTQLLTTAPYGYYPETSWQDDLALGAVELSDALALGHPPAGLPHPQPSYYLGAAANWTYRYLHLPARDQDTLNLYDVSGLAEYELADALARAGNPSLAVNRSVLLRGLLDQVDEGTTEAAKNPLNGGVAVGGGLDVVPHDLGLAVEGILYDRIANTTAEASFAEGEIDWVLGENAWGSSFIVGAGTTFPFCLQHQVANLAGSLNGTPPILLGATVDGPTVSSNLKGLGLVSGMRSCPVGGGNPFAEFNGHGASYEDNVRAWPTVEPADDYTVISLLAVALEIDPS